MRLLPRFIVLLAIFMLVISYQNFSATDSSGWDSDRTLQIIHEMNALEGQSPTKPILATPQSGSDLHSVGSDWLSRQGQLLLNGYDKKLEANLNEKLNSWVNSFTADEPNSKEASTEKDSADTADSEPQNEENHKKRKQNFRFTRVNALKYEIGESSYFDFIADPGNTRLNYSQIVSSNSKLGFEHRTSDNKTQMYFKYEW